MTAGYVVGDFRLKGCEVPYVLVFGRFIYYQVLNSMVYICSGVYGCIM